MKFINHIVEAISTARKVLYLHAGDQLETKVSRSRPMASDLKSVDCSARRTREKTEEEIIIRL
jgi:hypothetical protein